VLRRQGNVEDAISEFETALALNPNWLNSLNLLAWCKIMTGSIAEAIPLEEQAIRLSPGDPALYDYYINMGIAHLLLSRPDEAIVWFEKARGPLYGFAYSFPAAIYALKGETEKAAANLAEAQRVFPERYSSIARRTARGRDAGGMTACALWVVPLKRSMPKRPRGYDRGSPALGARRANVAALD